MTWLNSASGADAGQVFGLRPNLFADYQAFETVFWREKLLPPVLLELVRLRVAGLHRCSPELNKRTPEARAAGLSEERIQQLGTAAVAEFDSCEQACLDLAEMFVIDAQQISDAQVAAVHEHLGDAGVVALMEALALYDGYCRAQVMLGVTAAGSATEMLS